MKHAVYNRKGNVKAVLFVVGIFLIVSGIFYSQKLVNTLKEQSTEYIRFRIKVFESNINNPTVNTDINFLFNEVIRTADYPIIYTDKMRIPQSWKNLDDRLNDASISNLSAKDSLLLYSYLKQMASENAPISIKYQDSLVLGYYYYGFAPVIYKLHLFPFIAIGAAAVFILVGYFGFSYIKKSEQQFIWVGMAKETAHQLGTPLSSIAGWLELLKIDSSMLDSALTEINKDLVRLNKVANRFSKIGSVPRLTLYNINELIENVVDYFQRRLPNMQKKISLSFTAPSFAPAVLINYELFEWVLENLIKNSIDSIESKTGIINISLKQNTEKDLLYLDIRDSGKGISVPQKKNIFKPGFSTKKRGWGLGLSLARRIVEEYHGGKLFLKESKPDEGATFRIVLNLSKNNTQSIPWHKKVVFVKLLCIN